MTKEMTSEQGAAASVTVAVASLSADDYEGEIKRAGNEGEIKRAGIGAAHIQIFKSTMVHRC